jgi:hypothetical protein
MRTVGCDDFTAVPSIAQPSKGRASFNARCLLATKLSSNVGAQPGGDEDVVEYSQDRALQGKEQYANQVEIVDIGIYRLGISFL